MAFHPESDHPGLATYPRVPEPPGNVHHDSDSDESLALLPRGTIVRIVGNARTKQALLGVVATVKRAVGLGGWHFLMLDSGEEIKLQRNALLVLEYPTGNEQDFSEDEEEQRRLAEQQRQLQRQYQRQQQLQAFEYEVATTDSRARQRRAPRPLIPDEYAGTTTTTSAQHAAAAAATAAAAAAAAEKKASVRQLHQPRINLAKLGIEALKRYRSYYRLPEPQGQGGGHASKDELVSMVAQHFAEQTVDEAQVISHFLQAAKRHSMGGTHFRH